MRKFFKIILTIVGIAFVFWIAVIIGVSIMNSNEVDFKSKEKLALIRIEGPIITSEKVVKQLNKFSKDPNVKAIVLRIDSPGGGVAPSQEIYQEIRKVSEKGKIVVSSLGSVAASGGYYIAVATQKIYANPGTITGSIGVIMLFANAQELMEKIGLKTVVIKSGPFKDIGSFSRPMTPEEQKLLQSVIDNVYEQFVQAVSNGRHLPPEKIREIADGRILSGAQAKELGLVDELGTFEDTIDQAASLAGISGKPRIVEEKKEKNLLYRLLDDKLNPLLNIKEHFNPYPPLQYLWVN